MDLEQQSKSYTCCWVNEEKGKEEWAEGGEV